MIDMAKGILTELRREFSALLVLVGGILSMIGIVGLIYQDAPEVLQIITDPFYNNNVYLWFVVAGPLLLIAAIYYFMKEIKMRKEFDELMDTNSKAKFVRNMDRVEYLAWKLPERYEIELYEKKKRLRIK